MSNETAKASFSKEITDKYDLAGFLTPAKVDFGSPYRGTTIDLRTAPAHVVDQFCNDFPDQKFFTPKRAAASKSGQPS